MYAVKKHPVEVEIQNTLDCSDDLAFSIRMDMEELRKRGLAGRRPFDTTRSHAREAFLMAAETPPRSQVDRHNLADMLQNAWLEGIQAKDRLVVELDSQCSDGSCRDCGASLSNGLEECDACGSKRITQFVSATVSGPYARLWVEGDPYIDGTSWECDGGDFAYAQIIARPGLAADLEEEGFFLDQSNYAEDEE